MAFPGRPAHDFSSLYSRAPAGRFPSRPHAPSPGVGPFLSFPARYRPWAVPGAWWMRGSVLSGRGGL